MRCITSLESYFPLFCGGNGINGRRCLLYLTPSLAHWLYGNTAGNNFWGWRASWFIFLMYSTFQILLSLCDTWFTVFVLSSGCFSSLTVVCMFWLSMSSDPNFMNTKWYHKNSKWQRMRACFTIFVHHSATRMCFILGYRWKTRNNQVCTWKPCQTCLPLKSMNFLDNHNVVSFV